MPTDTPSARTRRRLHRVLGLVAAVVAALVTTMLIPPGATADAPASSPSPAPMTSQQWHSAMTQLATPAKGCFTAAYPALAWQSAACTTAPDRRYAPKSGGTADAPRLPAVAGKGVGTIAGPVPYLVGNGIDFSAGVSGVLNGATGSFPTVSGVTGETGGGVPNSYSLQLNSAPFASPICAGHPGCQGWEQFIFSNPGVGTSAAFIQFWILNYFTTCPAGWSTYLSDCYRNGSAVAVPSQPIANLASLSLSGNVTASLDTVVMSTAGGSLSASTTDSTLGLSANWNAVEFMIGGNGGGSQATFNPGSTITVKTVTHDGTTNAPTCLTEGFTGETNNLNLVNSASYAVGASPSIQSVQSNILTTPPSCASAHGTGDTHLETFGGTYYDFQADGTFTLARSSAMTVQSNQVSGASLGWPTAAVNSAVATQMGADTVALCVSRGLVVNGTATPLASGGTISLASGDTIVRSGSQYVVTDPQGDSVTATMNPGYLDVFVGLGSYPQPVTGLLANAPGTNNQLRTSTGTNIPIPVDLTTLYQVYGDSWRVPADQSLVAVCGDQTPATDPTTPLWADQLPTALHDRAQAVCQQDAVKDATLLEACTLDVAVLGDGAATEFIGEPAPVNVAFSEDTAGSPKGENVAVTLPADTKDRYVRLNFTANSQQSGAQVAEFAVNDTTNRDLALNSPVTVSSTTQGLPAQSAVDGNPASYWQSVVGGWPQTLTADLGTASALGSVGITLPPDWAARTQTLSVLGSLDGTTWTTLVGPAAYRWVPSQ
ncbi:discoidin domain-containing protein [Actinacidiphila sp. ITFR-21]|uniref:discoidin domain-containing protein n=1 Tax=Actinacidiphila sp. ITFR-21 TaxID=3075199 RepID=UPI00288BD221|nr:discoidin domain-containing protein [Streptomyces sp. ITFR-21]WNI16836.1 discoidin domain-containing protein [Streptomyces sp. ITFR-21]